MYAASKKIESPSLQRVKSLTSHAYLTLRGRGEKRPPYSHEIINKDNGLSYFFKKNIAFIRSYANNDNY